MTLNTPAYEYGGADPASDLPVLSLIGVRKEYGDHLVLDNITLDVQRGEVITLIGASGSGKSTLLKTINLLEELSDGQILLVGEDISDPRTNQDLIRSRIGIVFQQFNLFPHLNVLQNVTIALRHVLKRGKAEATEHGLALLNRIGLADKADQYPDRLSGGQQQRVALVRAIASEPELLLLDEITSALDPELVGEVLDLVRELKASTTILMATHEMGFAREIADRVVFLDHGRIAEIGTPEVIFKQPQNPRTAEFLRRVL